MQAASPDLSPENAVRSASNHFAAARLRGNEAFREGKYYEAIECYTNALDAASVLESAQEPERQGAPPLDQAIVRCNRAAAYLKLAENAKRQVEKTEAPNDGEKGDTRGTQIESEWSKLLRSAAEDSNAAMELLDGIPSEHKTERSTELRIKALHRRMRANAGLGKFADAAKDANELASLRPEYGPEAERFTREAAAANEREKQEAIEKLKEVGNSFLSLFGMSLENFQTKRNPDGTFSVSYSPKG
ncbi:hypothetical protein CCYA_CCYA05G1565 [Cyanidiococcus yangmingshanensis]|nr:hypothetical protein CCYA_CCYA05G1565 [Cyanidiococcus yangmingshanensis]